ncbi:programmed cell death 1 ligand 1-like [Mastacembelus armatus]|uniref:programmed cell death 1 ligand 1-like n=1 Tax=Mastacembelus armatus TaxID=205130 RepID=UPI000E461A8B|nr:programmed cell death 1 ligand 1-like [Mastacembelus armatus]
MARRSFYLFLMGTVTVFCFALGQTPLSEGQDVYQAKEHGNITLTWSFPVGSDLPPHPLIVDVAHLNSMSRIYRYDSRSETEEYPHEPYRGRVHCDPELARRGRVQCNLTDLRLSDTGTYQCVLAARQELYRSYRTRVLSVTAASVQPTYEPSKPETRERPGLYPGLGLFTVVSLALTVRYCKVSI